MYFIVTIDTEEDNWANYNEKPLMSNIEKLAELQHLFDKYNIKPTYLITYPVATDENSVSILREFKDDGRCEIGAHVHPWNTPPFHEEKTVENTMLCNLEKELQYKKIQSLHEMIGKKFHEEPTSFRSGRWGFDNDVAENIYRLGYRVDSSVSPYMNWEKYCGPDYSNNSPEAQFIYMNNGESKSYLLEIPATIGFLQENYSSCNKVLIKISKSGLKYLRIAGILDKLNIINKVMLSPEMSDGTQMIKLCQSVMKKEFGFLNMFFHSTSLTAGLTPFTKSTQDERRFFDRIEEMLQFIGSNNIKSITLSDSYQLIKKSVTK